MTTDTLMPDIDEKRTALVRALALLLDDTSPDDEQRNNLRARLHHGYDPSSEHAERGTLIGQNFYGDYRPLQLVTLAGSDVGNPAATPGALSPEGDLTVTSQPIANVQADPHAEYVAPAAQEKSLQTPFAVIRGPIGAIHLPGIPLADGSWVLTAKDLAHLSLPADIQSGLVIYPVALVDDEIVVGAPQQLPPQSPPDPPIVNLLPASGSEDSVVTLTISTGLADPTTTGTLSVVITGVPAAAQLSAGTRNADGSWSLNPADLANLAFVPPANWSGSLSLTISVTNTESGRSSTTTATLPVHVSGVADAPALSVGPATGLEGQVIPLAIAVSSPDTDGSETLTVVISGLPTGSVLSAGTLQANGSWLLAANDLPGLTLTPPAHWSGTLNLGIIATTAEDGTSSSTTATLPLSVGGIATSPSMTVTAASGTEGHAVPLSITVSMVDNDGSESLVVIIHGLPPGASLSAGTHNADGSWSLGLADLAGLTLNPPPYWGGSFNLTITAQTSENGTTATVQAQLPVDIAGIVETPHLTVSAGSGTEDAALPISIVAVIDDVDGSETLTIIVDGLPAGAILSAGTQNADGSWTLAPSDLAGLVMVPPSHWSGTANLTISAVAEEGGHSASIQSTLPISIVGVATAPSLSLGAAAGNEGNAIALPIQAALVDNDGSETLAITIGNLPAGATLSAGHQNADGSWTLAPADLAGLTLLPPANWSGSVSITVTATSSENGSTASTSGTLPLSVSGIATTPSVSAMAAAGNEDQSIPLAINAALTDTDGSETLTVTLTGLPAGAHLSAGVLNADGSWTLSPADLTGLVLTPPAHWSGSANITITATSSENGTTASASTTLPLSVNGQATTPSLNVSPAAGTEATAVALAIQAALTDTDGSETLSIVIDHLPPGATLSAGTLMPDGSWHLAPGDLVGLAMTPAPGWSGSANLTVTAISTENGSSASINATLPISISGVATPPLLTVLGTSGTEDSVIPMSITASLADTDGSETLSIVVSGVPADATLSAGTLNADGTWSLTQGDLAGLALIPPPHFSGSITLTVAAISSENGTTATVGASLPITIAGVASAPNLVVGSATGTEDHAIALPISASLADTDGSETLSVTITGVPAGASLSAGVHNSDGSWSLAPGDLAGLSLTPPPHWSGAITLTVAATSSENGSTATVSATLPITITGEATAPTLQVSAAAGNEDTAIPLQINAALIDTDGSEMLSILISGVPTGATLSRGTRNADGTWSVDPADLPALTLTPPLHWSGAINLDVAAIATENGLSAVTHASLGVTVTGVATAPLVSATAASGNEDSAIALSISAALADNDGSETLSVQITGVPAGASLSAGHLNADGSWSLTPAELTGLSITPPPHWSGSFNLTVTGISTEGGSSASTSATLPISVIGMATTPSLSVAAAGGTEGQIIPLVINAALVDTDGSETLSVTITGLPAGATLSAGTRNADGSWTLAPGDLAGLNFVPSADWSGSIQLGVTATSSENGSTAQVSSSLPINVTGIATAPLITLTAADGAEDNPIALTIGVASTDADGSDTLGITFLGVPAGATLSAGTRNADGSWTLTLADLTGLTLTPPAYWSGTLNLTVVAQSSEDGTIATSQATLPIVVDGVATPPTLSVGSASGVENQAIALPIAAGLVDTDGSETLSITISGVPVGATLSAGTQNPDGSWTLLPSDLSGLTMTPPQHWSGTVNLGIAATSAEGTSTASTQASLPVVITGVAEIPLLAVANATGTEDNSVPLTINAGLVDTDGSETLGLLIGGLPAGATLSAGSQNPDGTWSLSAVDLIGLSLNPPLHWSGVFNLTVVATSTEGATTATATQTLAVAVNGAATTPTLSVSSALGSEDTPIALNINAGLADTDGSETLSIIIGQVPAGATLSAGTRNADGSWTLSAGDLPGLTLTAAPNWSGALSLSVTAIAAENGTQASVTQNLALTVVGVADAPTVSAAAATGSEDSAVPLAINAALTDTDGSELLSVTISGLPSGASLSAGIPNPDGSWSLTPAQLSGLMLLPPLHASGAFTLAVTATASEDGTIAATTISLPVTIGGVATTPSLALQAASGNEDTIIPLNITAALVDTDGSETLAIKITGVPGGATLSAGTLNPDGSWSLTPGELANLALTPPLHWAGSLNLTVTATSSENGTTASASGSLPIAIAGVATSPHLAVAAANGTEDHNIPLSITASLADTDGSETLSLVITGLPAGASLSAGTRYADGSWNLSPGDLVGLALIPPAHWSGSFNLTVAAISIENGDIATVTNSLPVTISGEATTPTLSVSAANGAEDVAVPLTINAALVDTDGSETLGLTIAGLPTGATLSAGTLNADGTWSLTPAELNNLTLMPPAHWSGSFNLTVTATSSENGTHASIGATLPVTIDGVATAPTLSVMAASGAEDTNLPLSISAGLVDTDGSETLSILIDGLPAGASLSAGHRNADGSWSLAAADLSSLTLTPPAHWSGTFALTVSAISAENGTTAVTQASLAVAVTGVATPPSLTVSPASGNEDTAIALPLSAALVDSDGSETLSVVISGLPNGATLSAGTLNPDGSWSLTPAQLGGLMITPPLHWSGSANLTVTAISDENGTTATTSASLPLTVDGVATAPSLSVSTASGAEDTAIPLSINAALVDTDGSETLSLVVTGMPAGATLSAGTQNADGSWTLTPAQLAGLSFTPPLHWSGNASLTVAAISAENGTQAQTTATLPITVSGVATTPLLSASAANGAEDSPIPLHINATLTDTDGSETLALKITGVPAGATLSAGTRNADGSWSLQPGDLTNLTLTPPAHWAGTFTLGVTATSSENGSTASAQASLPVTVDGVATTPALSVTAASGVEDTPLPLAINAALVDTDGSEVLGILIAGLPAGATLSAGTQNPDGSWSLTPAQLAGLMLTPPVHWSGSFNLTITATSSENGTTASAQAVLPATIDGVATTPTLSVAAASGSEDQPVALTIASALVDTDGSETLGVRIDGVPNGATLSAGTQNPDGSWSLTPTQLTGLTLTPPSNWSGSFGLTVTATSSEGATTASTSSTLPVSITGVADTPLLNVAAASGSEDNAVALTISAALTDTDGSETLAINISGLPSGATLSSGTLNADGSWSLTPAQLNGLTLTPPVNWSGSFNLAVTATSSEDGTTATSTASLPVTIVGVADSPALSVSAASGAEDTSIPLSINAGLTDTDGSETLVIIITGVPSGATLSAGTHNPDGSWTLTPAELGGLTFTPPLNWSGSIALGVTATSSENGTTAITSGTLNVTVTGVADTPTLSVSAASGNEDTAIPLAITAALIDTDGSESLLIAVTGVPSGAVLSAGTHNPDGSWTLTPSQLTGLTLTPPTNWSGSFNLTITATSSENGTTANTQAVLPVTIAGVADAPTVSAVAATGAEDTPIALAVSAALADTDGSESLAVTITGVPSGAALSAGTANPDGSWSLSPAQLVGLTLSPPANWSGSFNLTVTATSTEAGTTATSSTTLPVTISGVADVPTLTVAPATGTEDNPVSLTIASALVDTDGSETLSIRISDLPVGASLSAGTHNPDDSWTLSAAQLIGLTLLPPTNWSGTANLSVTATSTENGTTASQSATLPITVTGIADTPNLSVVAASGNEDTAIPLSISTSLADTDGSETLSIRITGVPSGATLSAGTLNGDGSWSLTPAQLTGLSLSPPANWSGSFNLTVTATSSENGTTASQTGILPVSIAGVADAPTLSVAAANGAEDTPVALTITSALVDTDGSESLAIRISGLPIGASLSAGIHNPDDSWTLTAAQLTGLTLTPPTNWSGTASLTVAATSSENGTTATTQATLPLTITGIADMPTLSVAAASGPEDTAISLSISSALTDIDGSETLALRITGVPSGASLSAGTLNGDGSWSLTSAQLSGLTLTPPANWSGSFNMTVAATSSESGTTATTQAVLPVTVTGIADTPSLTVAPASGSEDTAISLSIAAALTDTDGSETLSLRITGVPSGALLSAGTLNGDGSWSLTAAQLSGLKLTPPSNFSGVITLTVAATASENGTTATAQATLPVTVTGVADTPTLSVSAASGGEDTNIALSITSALTDTDGSETLSIRISGLPTGATLSKGTLNGDGSWTLTPAQLSGVTFRPPLNWSGIANLSVTATSSENGTTASQTATLPVTVTGIADTPNLSVVAASGNEDTAIPLSISASLADTDGSETLGIRITGVPSGASLSAGTLNGDGSWSLTAAQLTGLKLTPPSNFSGNIALTVTATASENATTANASSTLNVTVLGVADAPNLTVAPATGPEDTAIALSITPSLADTDGSETLSVLISGVPTGAILSAGLYAGNNTWAIAPSALAGLTITPAKDFAGTINLSVRATSTETSSGSVTHTDKPLVVTVIPVADAPTLATGPSATVTAAIGNEDTAIPLNISAVSADADGSETLSVVISGMPTGAVLSAGTLNANGTWSLTAAQLTGLTFTPPLNRGDDYTLTVTVTSTDSNGATASTSTPLNVVVNAVADAVSGLTAANVTGAAGTQIPLTIAGSLTDTDGSETLAFVIHGMPDGFALSAGVNNGDNSWTVTPAQLSGLKLISPEQFNGQLNLHLEGVTRESEGSTRITGPVDFYARIGNYASGYLVDLGIDAHVGGIGVGVHVGVLPDIDLFPATGGLIGTPGLHVKEDTPILIADAPSILGLNVLSGLLYALSYVTFNNVPTGTSFSAGTNLGGGTWQFTAGQLNNLYMTPPANGDQDFTMVTKAHLLYGLATVTLTSTPVYIMGVADMPTLSVAVGAATEDANVALNITSALTDTDGSETLSFLVSGMPSGFSLNQGTNNGNGTWSLSASQAAGLAIVPMANYSGAASVTVSAISTERDGDQTVKQQTVAFNVTPVADAPILVTSGAKGTEDQPIALNLSVALTDTDGSESISAVTISGLPSGSSLTGATNNGNGTWSVAPSQIGSVKFVPPSHWSGDTTITVTATSREGSSGPTASTTQSIGIHVDAAATTPISSATDSTGDVDTPIGLHLAAALADTDGSEKLSIVVSGVPDGSSLSAGLNNGNGSWTLTSAQLSGLTLTPPSGFSGDLHLNMTAYSVEQSNGSTASDQHAFTVSVNAPMMMMAMMSFMSFGAAAMTSWTDVIDPAATDPNAADAHVAAQISASDGFSETSATDPHHNNDYQHAFDSTQAA